MWCVETGRCVDTINVHRTHSSDAEQSDQHEPVTNELAPAATDVVQDDKLSLLNVMLCKPLGSVVIITVEHDILEYSVDSLLLKRQVILLF